MGGVDLNRVKEACPTYLHYQDSCMKMEGIYTREIDSLQFNIENKYYNYIAHSSKIDCGNPKKKLDDVGELKLAELEYLRKIESSNLNLIALDQESEMSSFIIINRAIKSIALRDGLTMMVNLNIEELLYFAGVDYTYQVI